jgi:hypothetical protein
MGVEPTVLIYTVKQRYCWDILPTCCDTSMCLKKGKFLETNHGNQYSIDVEDTDGKSIGFDASCDLAFFSMEHQLV